MVNGGSCFNETSKDFDRCRAADGLNNDLVALF